MEHEKKIEDLIVTPHFVSGKCKYILRLNKLIINPCEFNLNSSILFEFMLLLFEFFIARDIHISELSIEFDVLLEQKKKN